MDNVTVNLIVGLVFGGILGALLCLRLQVERQAHRANTWKVILAAAHKAQADAEQRLATARSEMFALWKEADGQAGYYRSELAKHETARKGLDAEIDRISLVAVRAEARLLRMKHCQGCNDRLQHQTHCFSCGLHETVSETVRAVA